MTKEPAQQNLPGTTSESIRLNWSRKMGWSIKDLHDLPVARDCATMPSSTDRRSPAGLYGYCSISRPGIFTLNRRPYQCSKR